MPEDYVDKWTVASLLLTFWAVLGYFGYMMHYGLVTSPMDFVLLIGLPMGLLPLFAFLLSSEIQGYRKFHRSREISLKRFLGRTLIFSGLLAIVYLSLIVSVSAGLLNTNKPGSLLILVPIMILVGWSALTFLTVTRFREVIHRLTEGLW